LAVHEQSVTLFFIIIVTLAGIVAFLNLGRAEDPSFTIKQMTVVTAWPGATAQEMQDQVAEPLEKRLQELRWYDRAETFTRPGLAFTTLILRDQAPPPKCRSNSTRRARSCRTKRQGYPAASPVRSSTMNMAM
jgi:multidrug efflux pump subunit AcrB